MSRRNNLESLPTPFDSSIRAIPFTLRQHELIGQIVYKLFATNYDHVWTFHEDEAIRFGTADAAIKNVKQDSANPNLRQFLFLKEADPVGVGGVVLNQEVAMTDVVSGHTYHSRRQPWFKGWNIPRLTATERMAMQYTLLNSRVVSPRSNILAARSPGEETLTYTDTGFSPFSENLMTLSVETINDSYHLTHAGQPVQVFSRFRFSE